MPMFTLMVEKFFAHCQTQRFTSLCRRFCSWTLYWARQNQSIHSPSVS